MEYGISGYQSDYRFVKKDVVELDHKVIKLHGNQTPDDIYLLAMKEGSQLIYKEITLVVENTVTGQKQFYPLPTSSGMGAGLDIVDFNHDGLLDVGVYVFSGGTGNQIDYFIFFNQGNQVQLGFSNELFEQKLELEVTYLPYYQVEIKNMTTNETTILDLSHRSQEYLNAIYDREGNLKAPLSGVVAHVSDSDPINSKMSEQGHDLILTQRVLGRSHNDTLGYVQSYIAFDNGKYYVYRILISQ